MPNSFPISIPERLPVHIEPCPIVEAIFETRFVSRESWTTLPGLLYAQIRDKYKDEKSLPLQRIPEEIRRKDPALRYLPLLQFISPNFLIQLGPQVVSLTTKPNAYPGWGAIQKELDWLIQRIKEAGFLGETERLGVRYIDFFEEDVSLGLHLYLAVNGQPLRGAQTDVTTVLRQGPLAIRLRITNGAIVAMAQGPKPGSVLDLDAWFGPPEVDLFENGLTRFEEAHHTIKEMFFGLMKPELLAKLNPVYE